jgi:subtilase family serine protease
VPHVPIRLRTAFIAVGATALAAGVLTSAASAQPTAERSGIAGTHPAWATRSALVSAQPVTSGTVTARVFLAGRDPAGLAADAMAVSTPGSTRYGHYLTPAQVMARYGPTRAQVSAVAGWLTGAGLAVTKVEDEMGGYVAVQGPVQAAERAFGVTFGTFRGPDHQADRAPEQTATAPASLASAVLTVTGLDTAAADMTPDDTLPPPGPNYWTAGPCSKYYGQKIASHDPSAYGAKQPYTVCGYTPRQIRDAYHVSRSGMTGKGVTVAIVDAYASPTMPGDANQYARATGDRPFASGQYTQDLAANFSYTAADECDAASWYGEQTADIEAVHGMAPNARVVYVGAASCADQDLGDALALVVDKHLASIVSDSWGAPTDYASEIPVYNEIFQAGAAEGIGFFFSSGDSGYENPAEDPNSDGQQVDFPTSSPYVTSVGGTSLAIGRSGNYEFETAWGTLLDKLAASRRSWHSTPPGPWPSGYDGSSGGGVSYDFTQPSYQRGVVPDSLATALPNGSTSPDPMRVVPDVSALADPSTGMLTGETVQQPDGTTDAFSFSRSGGTSVSVQVFAGIEADAQQAAGHPLGFANPAIYARYGTGAFRDVTDHPSGIGHLAEVRNNYTDPATKTGPLITYLRTLGIDGEGSAALPAVKGYDDATGVGSPDYYIQSFKRLRGAARAGLDRGDVQGLDRLGAGLRGVGQVDRGGLVRRVDPQVGRLGRAASGGREVQRVDDLYHGVGAGAGGQRDQLDRHGAAALGGQADLRIRLGRDERDARVAVQGAGGARGVGEHDRHVHAPRVTRRGAQAHVQAAGRAGRGARGPGHRRGQRGGRRRDRGRGAGHRGRTGRTRRARRRGRRAGRRRGAAGHRREGDQRRGRLARAKDWKHSRASRLGAPHAPSSPV